MKKWLIIGFLIVAAPFVFFTAAFTVFLPSGTQNTMDRIRTYTSDVSPRINWLDVYMLLYYEKQNDFSSLSSAEIRQTASLFVHKVRVPNPKYDPKHPQKYAKYITKIEYFSLLDVMRRLGYSQSEYNTAISLETLFTQTQQAPTFIGDVTQSELRYVNVSPSILYSYVQQRDSVFTLQNINTIETAARQYNVNPELLLAVTGQEESFVPVTWPEASTIRNNPFNVYHSWQDYNTTLSQAANIAALTLSNKLSSPPPSGEDAIQWINDPNNPSSYYAQDPNWAYGVEDLFKSIESYVSLYSR